MASRKTDAANLSKAIESSLATLQSVLDAMQVALTDRKIKGDTRTHLRHAASELEAVMTLLGLQKVYGLESRAKVSHVLLFSVGLLASVSTVAGVSVKDLVTPVENATQKIEQQCTIVNNISVSFPQTVIAQVAELKLEAMPGWVVQSAQRAAGGAAAAMGALVPERAEGNAPPLELSADPPPVNLDVTAAMTAAATATAHDASVSIEPQTGTARASGRTPLGAAVEHDEAL